MEIQRNREALSGGQDITLANNASGARVKEIPKGNTFPRRSHKPDYPVAQDDSNDSRRVASHSISKLATAADIDSKPRREWAPDRSPLQRLELALGSLTKEEKRARAEEAERLAQVVAEETTSISGRMQNKPVTSRSLEPEPLPVREVISTHRKQRDGVQQAKQGEQSMPSQSGSFRERSALALGTGVTAGAIIAGDGSLSRSLSKKLRKEPPGDPWYNQRKDAESSYQDARQKGNSDSPQNTNSEDSMDDELPVQKNLSKKIEQMMGRNTSAANKYTGRKWLRGIDAREEESEESSTEELEEDHPRHHHHISDFVPGHHARDTYKPGQGLYLKKEPLKDWKQGSTGFLSAPYLDLDAKQTELEKNKAWWEIEDSGKPRSRPPRTRHDPRYDGENEDNNGTVFSDSSIKEMAPLWARLQLNIGRRFKILLFLLHENI